MASPFPQGPPVGEDAEDARRDRDALPEEIRRAVGGMGPGLEDEAPEIPKDELLQILRGYLDAAREARESGLSSREQEWRDNWDGYWSRHDDSDKEEWQAREQLPDVQDAVDRFAASLRDALVQGQWYNLVGPRDVVDELGSQMRAFLDAVLSTSGVDTTTGATLGFDHTFGDVAKSGALMACCAQVRVDEETGRVIIEALDARQIYLDPTRRNLYRIRQYEEDWHVLDALAAEDDSPWDAEAIARLQHQAQPDEEGKEDQERSSGTSHDSAAGNRRPITLHEYRCDLVDIDGEIIARNQQVVMADEREIVLGPRPNPFWHGRDWIVYAPVIQIPFSVYGRSFVEGFRRLADTFRGMTNLVLDAAFVSALQMFMVWAQGLEDPTQADSVHPGKTFLASDEVPYGTDFVKSVEMGSISPSVIAIWQGLQGMLRNAQQQNELSLGQLPPKGDITATEITKVDQGQGQLVRSVARDIEDRVVSPLLDLAWATALQFFRPERQPEVTATLTEETVRMITAQREDFQSQRIRFQVRGISETIARGERVRSSLAVLQTALSNEVTARAFMQRYSVARWIQRILSDLGIDLTGLELTAEERAEQMAAAQAAQVAQGGALAGGGTGGGAPGTAVTEP